MLFKSAQSFLCFRLMLTVYDRKERNGFLLQVFICHQITISQISGLKQSTNQFNFFYNLSSGLFDRVGDVYKFAVTKFDRFKLVSGQGDFTFVVDGRTFQSRMHCQAMWTAWRQPQRPIGCTFNFVRTICIK